MKVNKIETFSKKEILTLHKLNRLVNALNRLMDISVSHSLDIFILRVCAMVFLLWLTILTSITIYLLSS